MSNLWVNHYEGGDAQPKTYALDLWGIPTGVNVESESEPADTGHEPGATILPRRRCCLSSERYCPHNPACKAA